MGFRKTVVFVAGVCLAGLLFGQSSGRIGGVVTDPSGGVVAGAKVVCRNSNTGFNLAVETTGEGIFQCPELPIGTYEITVSQAGFQTQVSKGVALLTSQVLDLRFVLKLGTVGEKIEVVAEVPLVQTASSTVQETVTSQQMQDLPLNGRNPLQLVTLTAGSQLTDTGTLTGQQDNRGLTVNGLRPTENNVQLDGSAYNNFFFGSIPIMPNPDTLEEFTIQSSNYTARTSGAGAVVDLSTRSGTNQLHGSAFEFVRNTDLNARNFYQLQKPPFKLNQYGGTIGGPIRKDRTFFFFSYQGTKQRSTPSPVNITTATAAQRTGDFSALLPRTITDPTTNAAFPGNRIPVSRVDALAVKVATQYLPLPNSGTQQYISAQNKNIDDGQWLFKIDQMISDRHRLTGRYFIDNDDFQRPFNAPLGFFAANSFRNQSLTLRDTYTFNSHLTGVFSANFGRYARTQIPQAPGMLTVQALGANAPIGTSVPLFPGVRVNISGFVNIFSGGALQQKPTAFDYHAALSYTRGAHILQFGSDILRTRSFTFDESFTPGTWTFTGQYTGNAMADFFLGRPFTYNEDSGRTNNLRETKYQFWVQDDWKVRPRFTVNLGLRYEPELPPIDLLHNLVGFVPGVQSTIAPHAPAGLVYPGDAHFRDSIFPADWKTFAPRVGFAWDAWGTGKTIVRAGYGIYYVPVPMTIYDRTVSMQPSTLTVNLTNPQSFANPFGGIPGGSPYPRARIDPSQFASYLFTLPVSGGVQDPATRTGYSQAWNLTVERQFKDVALSVAYVGNHGVKIVGSSQVNPAVYIPNSTLSTDARRVYQGYSAIEEAWPYEYSNYHSLQMNLTKRTRRGLTILGNYTYGKIIDNNSSTMAGNLGPRDPFNLNLDRAPADFDVKHRAVISFVYDPPRTHYGGKTGNVFLNGWQLNSIIVLQTGNPFSVLSGTDRSQSGVGADNADVIGNASRPAGADQLQKYFNTAAFAANALGTFGSAGRNILRAPGHDTVDLAVFKNFALYRESVRLQFRAEAFNVQNRANFLIQAANSVTTPTFTLNSANFGKVLAADDPRVFQFGLKVMF